MALLGCENRCEGADGIYRGRGGYEYYVIHAYKSQTHDRESKERERVSKIQTLLRKKTRLYT